MDDEEQRITVRSREDFEQMLHIIELLYVDGVRSIRIELERPLSGGELERINEVLRRLPGLEISFCTPKSIVLQDIMYATPETVFDLMYEATRSLFGKVLEAVEGEDVTMAEAIEDAHDNVHRYAQRFRRQLSQSPKKTRSLFERAGYVSLLERVADYLSHTAHAIASRGVSGKVKWEIIRVMRMTKDVFESLVGAYRRMEQEKLHAILRAEEFLQREIKRLMERSIEIQDRAARLAAETILIHMSEILRGIRQVAIDSLKSKK